MGKHLQKGLKHAFFAFTLLFFFNDHLFPQNEIALASSVSNLRGEARGNLIRLSWTDASSARGTVYIYRSRFPFEGTINPAALGTPFEAAYGTQSFIDELEEPGTYYYFVAAANENGRQNMSLSFSGNTISVVLEASPDFTVMVPQNTISALQYSGTGPGNISVETRGETAILRFVQPNAEENAVLYRSTSPIRSALDLYRALVIQQNITSPYTDYPVPGIPYYYAIINEGDLIKGTFSITPGINSTTKAVSVNFRDAPVGQDDSPRYTPIPQVTMTGTGLEAFGETPGSQSARTISPEAARALEKIPFSRPKPAFITERDAEVFSEDMELYAEGELYLLGQIARGSFYFKHWDSSREELVRFLSLPRSDFAAARAHFYLGQTYFFLEMYRDALFEFLKARTFYPDESFSWIHACLPLLHGN